MSAVRFVVREIDTYTWRYILHSSNQIKLLSRCFSGFIVLILLDRMSYRLNRDSNLCKGTYINKKSDCRANLSSYSVATK